MLVAQSFLKMQNFCIISLLLVLALGSCTANKRMLKLAAGSCKSSEGATDADVDNLAEGRLPETQVQKCLYACLQKQFGISDGKKFSKQGFLKRSSVLVGTGEANKRKAEEIADECDGISNADRCQLGADIAKCIRDGLIKRKNQ